MNPSEVKPVLPSNLTIPTLPSVVQRISTLMADPTTGVREIAQVVASDAPLAAKVLKIANSAYYGLRERCLSTQQAAAVLGIRVLKNAVTQASVIGQFNHLQFAGFDLDELWRHAIVSAQTCQMAGKRSRTQLELTPDELYMCGLIHDIGRVVMLDHLKEGYVAIVQRSIAEKLPIQVVEKQVLGYQHTDVGQLLATRWGLPPQAVAAIQFHHGPDSVVKRDPVVALVARVNELVHHVEEGHRAAAASCFDARTLQLLGLKGDDVNALVEFTEKALGTAEI